MKYEVSRGKGKRPSAPWTMIAVLLFFLHALSARAQQTKNPLPDTACECGGGAIATTPTNAGQNFLLCFEENIDPYYQSEYSSGSYAGIYISSLGNLDTVTITSNRYPSMHKVFVLQPNSSMTYNVTADTLRESPGIVDTMRDLWIVTDETIDNRVVQVQATSPIVCYGLDYKRFSADAFCALPEEYSGTEYRILSYPSSTGGVEGRPTSSQFAVAAFEDNTTVTITPAALTVDGNSGGVPQTFTLERGQCVQIQADTISRHNAIQLLDLTGSMVTSSSPIAVYGSHVMSEIPDGFYRHADFYVTRDLLLETMPPTSTWGRNFVLNAFVLDSTGMMGTDGDLMRVLALDDSTVVTVNGQYWVTLMHNQFADSLIAGPTLVTSSGPLEVGEFEHSQYSYGANGDPFLAIVPPVDQTNNSYTFSLATDTNFRYQSVTIVADTTCQSSITLDGNLIPSGKFSPVPGVVNNRKFSLCEYGLAQGTHTISTPQPPEQGFTILAYGVGTAVSYGYAAGELLIPKRAIMIEYPPKAMGRTHTNTLDFHNTAYQAAYLDSAVFIPDNPNSIGGDASAVFGIHVEENVTLDIDRLDIGSIVGAAGSAQIHIVSDNPLTDPISGKVRIYSHLPSYAVEPAEMAFTLYPDAGAAADVAQASSASPAMLLALAVTATPNPFSGYTTIHFSVPITADVTMTLYDELGRMARHIASSEFPAGTYSVRIERGGLANGVYVCEITSTALGLHERIPIVAGE